MKSTNKQIVAVQYSYRRKRLLFARDRYAISSFQAAPWPGCGHPQEDRVIFMSWSFSSLMIFSSLCCYTACSSDGGCVMRLALYRSTALGSQRDLYSADSLVMSKYMLCIYVYIYSFKPGCVLPRETSSGFQGKLLVSVYRELVCARYLIYSHSYKYQHLIPCSAVLREPSARRRIWK